MDIQTPNLKVAILSDVSVGYGTPQILRIAESFADVFNAQVHIFEPDQSERMPIEIGQHVSGHSISLQRVYSTAHPYSNQGRAEYCAFAADRIRILEPQIILFSTMYGIQILDRINAKKPLKIFYCLEDVDNYYTHLFPLVRQCDIRVYPEENRRRLYSERVGSIGDGRPDLILYNGNNRVDWTPTKKRRQRIFYGGSFHRVRNLASYFLTEEVSKLPIDVYGTISGFEDNLSVARSLRGQEEGAEYKGYREADDSFFQLLSSYLYSIVIWNPEREDHYYACPNKFFDAVACGVPPICAPHPQCIELIKKWDCGILMDDWSFESLKNSLERALKAAGSDYYDELAHNCQRSVREELSWERQFEKLVPFVQTHARRLGILA